MHTLQGKRLFATAAVANSDNAVANTHLRRHSDGIFGDVIAGVANSFCDGCATAWPLLATAVRR